MPVEVPYYAQTAEFSCGAACAVMALKHFDPSVELGRSLEFSAWRQMNMVGIRGADPWGLSVPLLDAGLWVTVVTERERTFETDRWDKFLEPEEVELGEWAMRDNLRRARQRGVLEEIRAPTLGDVEDAVRQGRVPICLVHMGLLHGEDVPHWVVPTRIGDDEVTFHDPYPPKGRADVTFDRQEFWSIVEDVSKAPIHGARTVVVVGG